MVMRGRVVSQALPGIDLCQGNLIWVQRFPYRTKGRKRADSVLLEIWDDHKGSRGMEV